MTPFSCKSAEKSRIKLDTASKEIQFIFNQLAGPHNSLQELPLCAVAAASWGGNISSYATNLILDYKEIFLMFSLHAEPPCTSSRAAESFAQNKLWPKI